MNPIQPRPSSASFPASYSPPQQQQHHQSNKGRTWKACQVCRKRKIKCDGKLPCDFCSLNEKECSCGFTLSAVVSTAPLTDPPITTTGHFADAEALDNAAKSRAQSSTVSHRLDRLETLLTGLLPLAELVKTWAPPSAPSSSLSVPLRASELDNGQGDEREDASGKGAFGLAPPDRHPASAVALPLTNPVQNNLPKRTSETYPSIRNTPLVQPNQHSQSTEPKSLGKPLS
jgi:hypothetical protein